MDRKDLKIEAYRQRVAQIVTEYEDKCADYRIEITELDQQRQELQKQVSDLQVELEILRNNEVQKVRAAEADDTDEVPA